MTVDRSRFTPHGENPVDIPVPIDHYRTVPTERMANLLAGLLSTDGKVLEIGTGSGYQTAVLADRCSEVVSIEVNPRPGIAEKLPEHVTLIEGDGTEYDTGDKFDGVLVTFATAQIRPSWVRQLKDGARLVVPLKSMHGLPRICVYQKHNGRLEFESREIAAYAPFTGEQKG